MRPPPGSRLRRLVRPWLPAAVSLDVLDPAVADLQYEAQHARTTGERRHVILRGYAAIAHALVLSIELAASLRAAAALAALCATGALLATTARAAHLDGRVLNSALLAPVIAAPLLLRMLGTASSRRLFAGSLMVAMLTPALAGSGLNGDGALWLRAAHAFVVLVLLAPIAGVAAVVAGPDHDTLTKRAVTAVSLGGVAATAAVLAARWPNGVSLSIALATTPFYATLFAVLFALTLLPLLLLARPFIGRPAWLAVAGLVCSPLPLIAGAYIDHGTLTTCLESLRRAPLSFATSSLPFAVGAIAVGWMLPTGGALQRSFFHRS